MIQNIKWDVFTAEERSFIEAIVARGDFELLTKAVQMDSAEKEYWISKIKEQVQPIAAPLESEALKAIKVEASKGNEIDSPEKEAAWQKKVDEEKSAHEKKTKQRRKKEIEVVAPAEEVEETK